MCVRCRAEYNNYRLYVYTPIFSFCYIYFSYYYFLPSFFPLFTTTISLSPHLFLFLCFLPFFIHYHAFLSFAYVRHSYRYSRPQVYLLVISERNKFRRISRVNIVTWLNKQGILVFLMTKTKRLLFSTMCPDWLWSLSASFSTDIENPLPAVKVSEREALDISSFSAVVTKTDSAG